MEQLSHIASARKEFERFKLLGEKSLDQLTDDDLHWQYNAQSNSIAIIINHMWGNMLSRWTNFLTTDGEKADRQRDKEFEQNALSREELMTRWDEGWKCLFDALDSITHDNIDTVIYIRKEPHSIADAIHRQLAHYASHIGQIMYIGRMIKGASWQSLSIPKGQSEAFNRRMMG